MDYIEYEILPGYRVEPGPEKYFMKGPADRKPVFKPKLLFNELVRELGIRGESKNGPFYRWNGKTYDRIHLNLILKIAAIKLGNESSRARIKEIEWLLKLLYVRPEQPESDKGNCEFHE